MPDPFPPPPGYRFVLDENGDYVVDENGDYVIVQVLEEIPPAAFQ